MLVRVSRLRVLEGTVGSSKVAKLAANQLRVEFKTEPLPVFAGQAMQASSPVMVVEQLGHCQIRLLAKLLVRRMCFCTARFREPSSQKCSSSMGLPETVRWYLEAVQRYMVGFRTCK